MELFLEALDREVAELHANGVRLRFIGDRAVAQRAAAGAHGRGRGAHGRATRAEAAGGRELRRALGHRAGRAASSRRSARSGALRPEDIDEERFARELAARRTCRDPDLFIRTGGEQRISNFLLWNLAYTELYFTEQLWPDFDAAAFEAALAFFAGRERRFGLTGEQAARHSRARRPAGA